MENTVLKNIKERRTIQIYKKGTKVSEEELENILEAGRWAPSFLNKQPWRFIVVKDKETKEKINKLLPMRVTIGLDRAPVYIVTCVDTKEDPNHYVEAGANATQNMACAAQSMGLGSTWLGIYDEPTEKKINKMLDIPKEMRTISVLVVGAPKEVPKKNRKELSDLIFKEI